MPDPYVAAVQREVEPLVDLLVLVHDCAGLLGGTTAAQIDTLIRHRIGELVDHAALAQADLVIAHALALTGEPS